MQTTPKLLPFQALQISVIIIFALVTFLPNAWAQAPVSRDTVQGQRDYRARLHRLARILGETHAIERQCFGTSRQTWRLNMQSMLELEAKNDSTLNDWLVAAFNNGYRAKQTLYPICSRYAHEDRKSLARKARRLANELGDAHLD